MRSVPSRRLVRTSPPHPPPAARGVPAAGGSTSSSPHQSYLGIDAGGTGTRAVIADGRGTRGAGQAGPANWTTLGPERCAQAVTEAANTALNDAGLPAAALAGACIALAGYYPPWHESEAREVLSTTLPGVALRLEPDLIAAWAGATAGCPGIVLIAGTGAVAYGRDAAGGSARAGGWGPLLGDEGSGYWIGLESLRAVARALDGRAPATSLAAVVSGAEACAGEPAQQLHPSPGGAPEPGVGNRQGTAVEEVLRAVYRDEWSRERVAALCVAVASHAAAGDAVARGILERAAAELGALVAAVASRLDRQSRPLPVAPVGGVFEAGCALRAPLERWLAMVMPDACWRSPVGPPVQGALLLAQQGVIGNL